MADLLFLKRVTVKDTFLYLGVRIPSNFSLQVDGNNQVEVASSWTYEGAVWPPAIDCVWFPGLEHQGKGRKHWETLPAAVATSGDLVFPFGNLRNQLNEWTPEQRKAFLNDDAIADESAVTAELDAKFAELRKSPTLPLRTFQAYRLTEANRLLGSADQWLDALNVALGGSDSSLAIELLSGLIFIVQSTEQLGSSENVFVDNDTLGPAPISVDATQRLDRIEFRLASAGVTFTNGNLAQLVAPGLPGAERFSPYVRLTRSLGIEERPSLRTGHVVIPLKPPQPAVSANTVAAWGERPFQPVDRIGDGLVGELLNYRIELFNLHGRCTHVGRLMLARQLMSQPAPPTRGSARLIVDASAKVLGIQAWLDLPSTEIDYQKNESPSPIADIVVYGLHTPLIPTGFYADADDSAMAIARLMSDTDPSAVLASGVAGFQAGEGATDDLADARLSGEGLIHIPTTKTEYVEPSKQADGVDPDAQLAWRVTLDLKNLIVSGKGLQLYAALRRRVATDALYRSQRAPESALVALGHTIVRDDQVVVATVQHFEEILPRDVPLPVMANHHAQIVELQHDVGKGTAPLGVETSLRVVVDHADIVRDSPMAIGGYRIWMRETAAGECPWTMLSIVQAVPPLVKAYAPIESGRFWRIEGSEPAAAAAGAEVLKWTDELRREFFAVDGGPLDRILKEKSVSLPENTKFAEAIGKGDSAALLQAMHSLVEQGCACEYMLSVPRRRRLQRGDATALPDGNWVLFKDQGGNYLGRAWNYWGKGVSELIPLRRYILTEEPNAQDTLGLDDFGRIAWTWHGVRDLWGHDFEWAIEPLARHEALRQRIAETVNPQKELNATLDDKDRYSSTLGFPTQPPQEAHRSSIRVQRRKPLEEQLGVVQRIDVDEQDRFVFRVIAPASFLESTHNTIARSSYGALRVRMSAENLQFRHAQHFDLTNANVVALINLWLKDAPIVKNDDVVPLAFEVSQNDTSTLLGDFGEFVVDQPSCMKIGFTLTPVADAIVGSKPVVVADAIRQGRPLPRQDMFHEGQALEAEAPSLRDGTMLSIPLARLDWGYSGIANSLLSKLSDSVSEMQTLKGVADRALFRLPDPTAQVELYVRHKDEPFRQLALFQGPSVAKNLTGNFEPEKLGLTEEQNIQWGKLWVKKGAIEIVPGNLGTAVSPEIPIEIDAGHINLRLLLAAKNSDVQVVWRRDGSLTRLTPR